MFCALLVNCINPFLLLVVLSALDNMGFVANMVSLVLYFYGVMHFDLSNSANTLTNFMGSTFLLSLVGGFISDTYLNRFTTCLLFGSLEVMVSGKQITSLKNSRSQWPSQIDKSTGSKKLSLCLFCHLLLGFGNAHGSSWFKSFTPRCMWQVKLCQRWHSSHVLHITVLVGIGNGRSQRIYDCIWC